MVRTIAKDHVAKRRRILSVAAKVFARDGIARASMNEVARACGISKANSYHYYDSKDDLVFDILDTYLARLRDRICSCDLADLPPSEQLHTLTLECLLAYDGMDNEHKIQAEGLPSLSPDRQEILKGHQRALVARLGEVLAACAPEKLGNDTVARREITMSVFGMLNWFYMWAPRASRAERKHYAATVADLTLNGLRNARV